jgi:4-carboxymuconolactone decarboxylase
MDDPVRDDPSMDDRATDNSGNELFAKGLKMRRAVLGDAYVDSAADQSRSFGAPLQDLVTEYCWGAIWTRTALEPRFRSLLTIGILTALNRPQELRMHVLGAVRNGCSQEEIEEVLLQTAAYCGIPAALDAFRVARTALFADHDHG